MVNVITSHHKIWNLDQVIISMVSEYLSTGCLEVDLYNEGPCADSVGLYKILDQLCSSLNIPKSKIVIHTWNFEETHPEYKIMYKEQYWIIPTVETFKQLDFVPKKTFPKKLFGCLFNVPSWDRLCLLSYIHFHTQKPSFLHCNGIWEGSKYNSFYLNEVTDFFPEQIFEIVDFLKTGPTPVLNDLNSSNLTKPDQPSDTLKVIHTYNDFFIDIVAETYTQGLTFFLTEKTLRPMLALTPFIIQGPRSFLSTLKSDYKIKSFDKWWNEDYDNFEGKDRIKRIFKVIDHINTFSETDWANIYQEMQPILKHNQKIWLNYK